MVFFIISSVSISVVICARSYVNSKIRGYSAGIEQYVLNAHSDNDFVKNGINVNTISEGILQANNVISELKSIIPSNKELKINKNIYDKIVGFITENLQKKLTAVSNAVDTHRAKDGIVFADENGIITVSSILGFLTLTAIKQVNVVFMEIIILLMIPLVIYVAVTVILAVIKGASDKRKTVVSPRVSHANDRPPTADKDTAPVIDEVV